MGAQEDIEKVFGQQQDHLLLLQQDLLRLDQDQSIIHQERDQQHAANQQLQNLRQLLEL